MFAPLFIHPKSAAGLPHGLSLFSGRLRVQIDSHRGTHAEFFALVVGIVQEARGRTRGARDPAVRATADHPDLSASDVWRKHPSLTVAAVDIQLIVAEVIPAPFQDVAVDVVKAERVRLNSPTQ